MRGGLGLWLILQAGVSVLLLFGTLGKPTTFTGVRAEI
jgi:hypothetical protein